MGEWKVGKQFEFIECAFTARRENINKEMTEVSVENPGAADEELLVETEVEGGSGYGGCHHTVCTYIPMNVLIAVLEGNGFKVTKE